MSRPARAVAALRRRLRALPPAVLPMVAGVVLLALVGGVLLALVRPGSHPAADRERSTAPTAAASGAPSELDLPRVAWWGGPAYYARFSKAAAAGWTNDTFFPIAVFYGKPAQARELASLGINTYMGAEHDGSPISRITSTGIAVIAQSEWTPEEVGDDTRVVGWHASDECEMGSGDCPSDDENVRLTTQEGYVDTLRGRDDGRFIQANFGNGVLGTYWAPHTMADQVALMDVTSVDKYAYTSPAVRDLLVASPHWPKGLSPRSARAYGWLQDRMAGFMRPDASTPNWVFVETAKPFLDEDGATSIDTDQIGGAVWNAVIHGAAGISYFDHNNSGCGTYALVDCSQRLRSAVGSLDAEVASLAPVINTQGYVWDFGSGLDTALKVHDGSAYVLAMPTGDPGQRTFRLPPGVHGTTVTVVGEGRTIPVTDGRFSDDFAAEYSHHVYRIALGG